MHTGVSVFHWSNSFVYSRLPTSQISNYPKFLKEIGRMLRPGGMVLLIEPDLEPMADGKMASEIEGYSGLSGWFALWQAYHYCLHRRGIDVTVPQNLDELLAEAEVFENITVRVGSVPIGFWPRGKWLTLDFKLNSKATSRISHRLVEFDHRGDIVDVLRLPAPFDAPHIG